MKKISEVSRLAGVSRRTLQYYDDLGILGITRSESNYRLYDVTAMQRLWKIMVYKELGLELKQIKILLDLSEKEVRESLQKHIVKIEKEICGLTEQVKFTMWILEYGVPETSLENESCSYIEEIIALKKLVRES